MLINRFFLQYSDFTKHELDTITARFKAKKLARNSFLLREGGVCRDLVIMERGCLRLFYILDDVEISVWFTFPGSSAIEINSFISGLPSRYFIQAIDDSEVWVLPKQELEALYAGIPAMQTMMRKFWEDAIVTLISRFTSLQTDTAEKRYLDLLDKPDYLATIPQKYLASFIGVTPTSLSRIRKRILKT